MLDHLQDGSIQSVMELPKSTEALTKLLRSKDTSTGEICEIVSQLDQADLYFPNKENFVLELIIDRWNDQRLEEFKKNYKIWKLFNKMWLELDDEVVLKRLLKRLRFVPHLIQSLQIVDSDYSAYVEALGQTCGLINSLTTVEVSLDNAVTIIGKAIDLVLKIPEFEQNKGLRMTFLNEIETLVDVRNITEVPAKSSTSYSNHLLLPSLEYFARFARQIHDPTIEILNELLGSFLFGKSTETVKLVEKFAKSKSQQLSSQNCSIFFTKCIFFLSREHFKDLEKIFSLVVRLHPKLSSKLLKELSLSKKTMSQDFLQSLFNKTIDTIRERPDDLDLWQLIYYILTLDVEIGIKNNNQILALITSGKADYAEWSNNLWTELINCHKIARELPQFFKRLENYCRENIAANALVTDEQFTTALSDISTSFATTQLKNKLSELLDALEANPSDRVNCHLLMVMLRGLSKLSYTVLADYREILRRVFDLKVDDERVFWNAKYLIMDIFDDIIPEEILNSPEKQLQESNLTSESPIESFYYFFKVREYRIFDMLPVIHEFLKKISLLPTEEQASVLRNVLINWSTMVNSLFPHDEIRKLVKMILTEENIFILEDILNNDDIFEESEIMHTLVYSLSQSFEDQKTVGSLLKIPIQCINKSIRIDLINKIGKKPHLTVVDKRVLVHLLANPTFRSELEKDWECLQTFMIKKMEYLTFEDPVFETLWANHLSQQKESVSVDFIEKSVRSLSDWLAKGFDPACFQVTFLALKNNSRREFQLLRHTYVEASLKVLSDRNTNQDPNVASWLLRSLYYICEVQDLKLCQDTSSKQMLSKIVKDYFTGIGITNNDLLVSMFLLYSKLYSEELEYLYAQFMVLRAAGVKDALLCAGVEVAVKSSLEGDFKNFNSAFINTFESFESCSPELVDGLLELYCIQLNLLEKDNSASGHLFTVSVSSFYTHCTNFIASRDSVLKTLNCIGELLISKAWLFSQYCIETLFPMCLRLALKFVGSDHESDQIFLAATKIISNILFTHRIKLSNRHHIIIAFVCESLELLSAYRDTRLTSESAKSLARLITNLCEPNGSSTRQASGKYALNSKTSEMKNSLRKHVPVLLVRYIHLSVNSPFDLAIRNELATAIYSIFDLLSQDGLNLVNAALDHAGRQYLKGLYIEYKKFGKWRAD